MAKAAFGEYSAFTVKNGVRYQKNNKLVKESSLPAEVVTYLNKQLGYTPKAKAPLPTEEEKKKLREESLKVPDHLKGVNTEVTEEDLAKPVEEAPEIVQEDGAEALVEEPLSQADFEDEPPFDMPEDYSKDDGPEPIDSDFLESVSVHTAPLEVLVQALHERFGIYTAHLKQLPVSDEINPLTGELFTKYHLGIAYQAAVRAKATGYSAIDSAEEGRRAIDEGRKAHKEFRVDPQPATMSEARQQDSFAYRTSPTGNRAVARTEIVHEVGEDGKMHAVQKEIPAGELGKNNGAQARYDKEEEQMLVQPRMGVPVIRPNWK